MASCSGSSGKADASPMEEIDGSEGHVRTTAKIGDCRWQSQDDAGYTEDDRDGD
jgi:hypothetical protein